MGLAVEYFLRMLLLTLDRNLIVFLKFLIQLLVVHYGMGRHLSVLEPSVLVSIGKVR